MPSLFGDLSYARPENLYTGLPVDEIKALNATASQQYQNTRQSKDALDVLYNSIDLEERNAPIKKRALEELRGKFSDLVSKGNYQDAQYLVAQAAKDFQMDNELQGAIESRKREIGYNQDLKKKLDKGEITPDIYNYAISRTRQANKDRLIYNSETMQPENMFSGQNVLDDKSKEIYDLTYKRIADWKPESTLYANGKSYKKDKVHGFTYDLETGERVDEREVFNALKTEVEKTYEPYLKQEREIENYKKFYNPETDTFREVRRSDINLVDDDIRNIVTGISKKDLNNLKNDSDRKEKGAKLAYENALKQYNSVDLNDPKTLEKAYTTFQNKNQVDRYVYPAAEKAGYIKFDHKLFDDDAAKMALAHKYKKAEIDYEKAFVAPLPMDNSQLEEFTSGDYQKSIDGENQLKTDIVSAQQRLAEAAKTGNPTYIKNAENEVQRLKFMEETAKNKQLEFVKALTAKDPRVVKEYIVSNAEDIINEIKSNPAKYSSALNGEIAKIETFRQQKLMEEYKFNPLTRGQENSRNENIVAYGDHKRAFLRNIDELYNQISKEKNKEDLIKVAVNSTSKNYSQVPANILDAIEETKRKYKDFSIAYNTNVLGVDANSDKAWERPIVDRVSDLVKNSATNWLIGNTSLDEIASGEADGFEFVDEKGNSTLPDLSKSEVRPQINHISGLNTVRVMFKDKDGHSIYRQGDDKKGIAAVTLTPGNQEGISTVYKQLGETLKQSSDGNAQKQGMKILGYTKFAPAMSGVYLSNMNSGEKKNVIIPSSVGELYLEVKKGPQGFETFINTPGKGLEPFILKNYGGKESNTFGSKEQFEELLELNGY